MKHLPLRLELGSGGKRYIRRGRIFRIDLRPAPFVDVVADLNALPFRSEKIDECFSIGVMEHFSERQARHILLEIHRVLKPGGRCRIVTTSLKSLATAYLSERISLSRALSTLYGYDPLVSRQKGYDYTNRHFMIFDREWFHTLVPPYKRVAEIAFSPPAHSPLLLRAFELTKEKRDGPHAKVAPWENASSFTRFFNNALDAFQRRLRALITPRTRTP